jgi:hypothetical protein
VALSEFLNLSEHQWPHPQQTAIVQCLRLGKENNAALNGALEERAADHKARFLDLPWGAQARLDSASLR